MADNRKDKSAGNLQQSDFAQEEMGRNRLQANDQTRVRNERKATPDVKQQPDEDVIESFEKQDKDLRAREDLGKGNRKSNPTA